MERIFKDRNLRRLVLVLALYWSLLLTASVLPGAFVVSRGVLLPLLIAGGLPTLWITASALWRIAGGDAAILAYRDDLTGLDNRRAFVRDAHQKLNRSKAGALALILLDIDGLKSVNEECGHLAGDQLLAAAGRRLAQVQKASYRIGGDEFALLVDRAGGGNVVQVLKELVPFTARFSTCGHDHCVSISYGYSSNRVSDSFEALFHRADERLRQFKRDLYENGGRIDRRATSAEPPIQISSLEERRKSHARERFGATV